MRTCRPSPIILSSPKRTPTSREALTILRFILQTFYAGRGTPITLRPYPERVEYQPVSKGEKKMKSLHVSPKAVWAVVTSLVVGALTIGSLTLAPATVTYAAA